MKLSPSQLELLESLRNRRELSEVSKITGRSKQAVLFHLKPLLRSGLVRRLKGKRVCYQTSKLGLLVLEFNARLRKLEGVVSLVGKFFSEHDLAAIPHEVFEKIYMLDGCWVSVRKNPYEFHDELEGILTESGWAKGLSSVYHERFPELFASIASNTDVELILTKDVFDITVKRAGTKLNEFLRHGKMYVCDNVRLAFVVSEKGFAMALYKLDGVYDAQNILICRTEDAVRWGLKLFEYYKLRSREVKQFS